MSSGPSNQELADALTELGDLYELDGANVHRVLAYRNAAKVIAETPQSVAAMVRAGTVTALDGIGATLAEKLTALIETGAIPAAERLRAQYPPGLLALTRLPGLGPKRVRLLHAELAIDSLAALEAAARAGRLRTVKGLGPKFEQTMLDAVAVAAATHAGAVAERRLLLPRAVEIADQLCAALRTADCGVIEACAAGGIRRGAETVKDIDIVVSADDPAKVAAALAGLAEIDEQTASAPGEHAARALTHGGVAVDLRVVRPDRFGNLLQHFTGSKAHNTRLREQAVKRGLHVSEYGIADDSGGPVTHCATEQEVYARLDLPYIEPELREDRGELEPGRQPPVLVTESDLRGELHCHTRLSDGRGSLEQMVDAARRRGLSYLAITDHSATHGFGNDVQPGALREQIERVRELNAGLDDLELLIGTETNILPDGSPDYDDELLSELDWVVGSVHTRFAIGSEAMTARLIAAIEHPLVDCIGHLTGRRLLKREPYALDVDAVIAAAARTATMLEINGAPERRDLNEVHARQAHAAGVRLVITTDAHGPDTLLTAPRWGIATARRAGLGPGAIANTLPWNEFAPLRKRARP